MICPKRPARNIVRPALCATLLYALAAAAQAAPGAAVVLPALTDPASGSPSSSTNV
jgi:hypothetical protein